MHTLEKKNLLKRNFQAFRWLVENSPNSSCHVWIHKSVFLWILHQSSVSWDATIMYLFSRNLICFGQKEPIKKQNFRLSTAHVKFHQIFILIGSFCWNFIKFQLKKYRGFMSHDTEDWCKIRKKNEKNLVNFDLSSRNSQIFHFDWFLLCKVYSVWPKKVQRSYLSRHWRVIQNLKKNWLVIWKMTWGIWQIFTRALEMGSFYPK